MTIIESYSVGIPVIGARIGGIPEIVVNGKTGFQFESGNVEDLKSKINCADQLTAEAYTKLSQGTLNFAHDNLSLENYYPRLISFYKRFVKE
jgi:glycosyltransferase involved in cell wall biosynthesis